MAFTFYPADNAHFPVYGGAEAHAPGFALDAETGLRCYRTDVSSETSRWVIVSPDFVYPSFSIADSAAGSPAGLYNALPYWRCTGGFLFRSISGGWILFEALREPRAYLGPDGETWVGDGWYEFERAPNDISVASVGSVPAGTNLNDIAVADRDSATGPTATPSWPRWERRAASPGASAPVGYYDPVGGATGVVRLGSLRFRDSDGRTWTESADGKSYRGEGGTATWRGDYGAWIIGTRKRGGSWAQCAADPSAAGGATFTWMRWPAGGSPEADPEREALVWTFAGLATSGERTTIYMAEVSAWR